MARRKDPVSEMRRGVLELALLLHLDTGAACGADVMSDLDQNTDGRLQVSEGALYPALHRMEKKGLLSHEWIRDVQGRKPRKYYSLTDEGRTRLAELLAAWHDLRGAVDALEGGRGDA